MPDAPVIGKPAVKAPGPPASKKPIAPPTRRELDGPGLTDADVWVPLTGEEVTDAFTELFETFTEAFGPEWELQADKAKRMGERWARLGNRWATRVKNKIALKALVYAAGFFAVLQLGAMVSGRALRTISRKREEKKAAAEKKAELAGGAAPAGNVVAIDRERPAG